jgi:hypothetical protein
MTFPGGSDLNIHLAHTFWQNYHYGRQQQMFLVKSSDNEHFDFQYIKMNWEECKQNSKKLIFLT